LLGTRQTGEIRMRIADFVRDQHLLPQIQQASEELMKTDPELPEKLIERWLRDSEALISV